MVNATNETPKVLVVDDEAEIRTVVGMLLVQAGYEVVLAEYGQIGYSKALTVDPNLILLDLMMPVMDGFQVLRRLKSNQRTSQIPVIILTAKIDAASERECMRLGAVDYIKKPWGPHELEDRIGMALGYPKLNPPGDSHSSEPPSDEEENNSQSPNLSQSQELLVHQPDIGAGCDESENQDTSQPTKFRTRQFRLRPDGVDPASLI